MEIGVEDENTITWPRPDFVGPMAKRDAEVRLAFSARSVSLSRTRLSLKVRERGSGFFNSIEI